MPYSEILAGLNTKIRASCTFLCTINSSLSSPIQSLLSRAHSKEKREKRINISRAST